MQLFFIPYIDPDSSTLVFDKAESRHIITVLRKKAGDQLMIGDGKGMCYKAVISDPNEKRCQVTITDSELKSTGRNYRVHIAIAPTKLNDRYEWFLEKATEIGIDQISPIICDRSERKVLKVPRMKKIIVGAAKQSHQFHLPKLEEPQSFKEFIARPQEGIKMIAHCMEHDKKAFGEVLSPGEDLTILIGPEGDFTPAELSLSLEHQYIPVSLGVSRLRTETAGLVAVLNAAFVNQI
jgi:16S rRNA (uracil1498-N3)-methyltransferase